jgi:hypothetical protein
VRPLHILLFINIYLLNTILCLLGDQWTQYSLSHSGLGIWNKDRHLKLSLEFVCLDYIGSLLPTILSSSSSPSDPETLFWNNSASIVLTRPINETYWSESRLLAVSNGGAYKALVQYLKDHEKRYSKYQVLSLYPSHVLSSSQCSSPRCHSAPCSL